jgi:uncharacterized protein (TIGR03437 family)
VGLGLRRVSLPIFLLLTSIPHLKAAPRLRLSAAAVGPISVVAGSNGPRQEIEAFNIGDGALNLRVSSSVPWIVPTVGAQRSCSLRGPCIPIQLALQTASLGRGPATGVVTVSDANAVDAPQEISVTVYLGGGVPDRIDLFVAPGRTAEQTFFTAGPATVAASTQSGGPWLEAVQVGRFASGSTYLVTARHLQGMAEGTFNGTIAVSGSSFAADNRSIPVTLRVTSQPIAQSSRASVSIRGAQNSVKQGAGVRIANAGTGTLNITGVTTATTSGGPWLTAERVASTDVVAIVSDPANLAPGTYNGTVTVASNAANGPVSIPVQFTVSAQAPPVAYFEGVVNNATFEGGDLVAPGTIAAVFGEQLFFSEPASAAAVPLPTDLSGTKVLVNGVAAPLYYSSYGQVNFQIPYETAAGEALVQVERGGQRSNAVSVRIAASTPRLLRLGVGDYGIIVNTDGSLAIPPTAGLNSHPAKSGDALVLYAIGLGQSAPAVTTGAGAPSAEPLARVLPVPRVAFSGNPFSPGIETDPLFAGLTPGFVGLYQVNVVVPADAPRGNRVDIYLLGRTPSNRVQLAIQ